MAELTHHKAAEVQLLRRYVACREAGRQPLPSLMGVGSDLKVSSFAIIALASVFHLTERCLNRVLVAGYHDSQRLSSDERAILRLKETYRPGHFVSTSTTPCGLLHALSCAIASARVLSPAVNPDGRALDEPEQAQRPGPPSPKYPNSISNDLPSLKTAATRRSCRVPRAAGRASGLRCRRSTGAPCHRAASRRRAAGGFCRPRRSP